jgi:hypothetical protein
MISNDKKWYIDSNHKNIYSNEYFKENIHWKFVKG